MGAVGGCFYVPDVSIQNSTHGLNLVSGICTRTFPGSISLLPVPSSVTTVFHMGGPASAART